MIARASAVDVTAGAERFTHIAFKADAMVEAQSEGAVGFLAAAPPIA
jgi:hypothetical protein